jgi:phosphate transport system protein
MDIGTEFQRNLVKIQSDVLSLGGKVGKAIIRSVDALRDKDLAVAARIIADNAKIKREWLEIQGKCIELIAAQQLMAGDLHAIMSVTSIIKELERIGDYANDIAKMAIMMEDEPPLKLPVNISCMAEQTVDMLERILKAFYNYDYAAARRIALEDEEIDHLFSDLYHVFVNLALEDPKTVNRVTRLMCVAHNLERSADSVTNICIYVSALSSRSPGSLKS